MAARLSAVKRSTPIGFLRAASGRRASSEIPNFLRFGQRVLRICHYVGDVNLAFQQRAPDDRTAFRLDWIFLT